jgi:hypothetical protein
MRVETFGSGYQPEEVRFSCTIVFDIAECAPNGTDGTPPGFSIWRKQKQLYAGLHIQ